MSLSRYEKNKGPAAENRRPPAMHRFAVAIMETEEMGGLINTLVPAVMEKWAGKNLIKKIIGRIAGKSISKGFRRDPASPERPVSLLLQDKAFLRDALSGLPGIANAAAGAASSLAQGLANLPDDDKAEMLNSFISGLDLGGEMGRAVTSVASLVNGVHRHDPTFFSCRLLPGIQNWIEKTDFGELKELIDTSSEDIIALIRSVNVEMWGYPAKMVCFISIIPTLANIFFASIGETLAPVNTIAPDLLADVIFGIMREIDGRKIGRLINEFSELVRKIHTGSTLIGENGKPELPVEISRSIRTVLDEVDIDLLLKSRSLMAEIRESVLTAFIDMVGERPEIAKYYFRNRFTALAARVRAWGYKAGALATIFTDDEIAGEFSRGMQEIDAQQLAETISRLCALLNGVKRNSPEVIGMTLSQIMNSLDMYEVGETVRWLAADIVNSLKPIASEVVPPVIRGIADLLSPKHYDSPEELEDALAQLRNALNGKEAAV